MSLIPRQIPVNQILAPVARPTPLVSTHKDRFFRHVKKINGGCWEWAGFLNKGYGQFRIGQTCFGAHRVSYVLAKGEVPGGLFLDHLCRNRACVNPDHLEPVTCRENVVRGVSVRKKYCINGHERTPENLYVYTKKDGKVVRNCRPCVTERKRKERTKS